MHTINNRGMESDKPRRLEADTIAYVTSLKSSIASIDRTDSEALSLLIDNVLDELKSRLASVAADRNTHDALEEICQLADLSQLLTIAYRLSTYAVFLASNRHASHVLQTVCARLIHFVRQGETEDRLEAVVLELSKPLVGEIGFLASDVSGSHVVRALLSLLSGAPAIAERKGKSSKHKHGTANTCPLDTVLDAELFSVRSDQFVAVPTDWTNEFARALHILAAMSQQDLLSTCVSPSGCVVLGLVVRIASNGHAIPEGCSMVAGLVSRIVLTGDEETGGENVVYGLAGERGGSHFLEAALECCEVSLFASVLTSSVLGRAAEYCADGSGNFVLQSVLRRLTQKSFPAALRHDLAVPLLNELTNRSESGRVDVAAVVGMLKSRGGVVYLMLTCASALPDLSLFNETSAAVIHCWSAGDETRLSACLCTLLKEDFAEGEAKFDGNRTQLSTGRLLKAMLAVRAGDGWDTLASALSFASKDALLYIATHGQLSKLVLDTLFEMADKTSPTFLRLAHSFVVIAADVASHFVGQHVFKKLFDGLQGKEKELIVSRLVAEKDRLGRSKEGRASLQHVGAEVFAQDVKEWRKSLLRKEKAGAIMSMLDAVPNLGTTLETGDEVGVEGNGKRKRKRKRGGAKADAVDEEH